MVDDLHPVVAEGSLTPREGAVLGAVERRLGNQEIAGELFISVRTVESHIASLRRKLGAHSRTDLVKAARARLGTPVRLPHNSFVGRDRDLAAVSRLLDRHRWVTVAGPAGCGKTRLALELAAASTSRVPLVVELEDAGPDEVVPAIAKTVGLGAVDRDVLAACGVALGDRPHLLVLDNCDRVTGAVSAAVRELLAVSASLTVLSTSRSPAGGSDEAVHLLEPLLADAGAVDLFLDRARAAAPSVLVDPVQAATVCRRLDGLPLAIEMAAARVRHLPVAELIRQLREGFGALGRAGDTSSRHRTLEAAFEWTWDLLDDDERRVLSHLAALPRTFDTELAEVVGGPGAVDVVLRLLDRSLVCRTIKPSDPVRFRLLGSLRAFVLSRSDPAVVERVREAHAEYHVLRADRVRGRARTDDSRALAEEAKRLCPEINAAVAWSLDHGRPELALRLAHALAVGGEQFSPDLDSLGSIARVARHPDARRTATAAQLADLGRALTYGDLDVVADLARLALERADDPGSRAAAHLLAGEADAYRDRGRSALEHLDVAARLADEELDVWLLASAQQTRGTALRTPEVDDPVAATAAYEAAMHSYALAGDAMHVNNARYMMAATAAEAGLHDERVAGWVADCVAYARRTGQRHELAHALLTRARLSPSPDPELPEAVATFRAVGDLRCLTRSHLLRADRAPSPAERERLLEAALGSARNLHDVTAQATVLGRLVDARWARGDRRAAAEGFGALVGLVGADRAASGCPDGMAAELADWESVIAEGRAHAVT